jgi:hypothetical protein
MWHFADWQLTQTPENYLAWKALAGQLLQEDILREKASLGGRKGVQGTYKWWMNQTPERRSENASHGGKIGGRTNALSGHCARIASSGGKVGGPIAAKKINAQRWKCLETGFISTPAGLSSYQRARGIDTSLRIRIS